MINYQGGNKVAKVDRMSEWVGGRETAILNSTTREGLLSRIHLRNDREKVRE